jgi:hypothetical protein
MYDSDINSIVDPHILCALVGVLSLLFLGIRLLSHNVNK